MGTIKDKLEYLNETKREIRRALISRQVAVNDNDTFRSYADKIKSIPITAEIEVMPLNATENKEYEADEGKAYNPVTVDVKPNVKTKTIDKAGTFKAKDDDCDGFSEVTVDVKNNLMVKNLTSEDLPEEPTEKITIKPSTEPDAADHPDRLGYSEVNIDLEGKFQEMEPIEIDAANFGLEKTFEAKDDKLYGYSKVTVRIVESKGPFTVKFYDGRDLLYETTVEQSHQSATYMGPDLSNKYPGKVFKGWNPSPFDVMYNLNCYAEFEKNEDVPPPTIEGDTTGQSWKRIAETKGLDLPKGTIKTIMYGAHKFNGQTVNAGMLHMELVAKPGDKYAKKVGDETQYFPVLRNGEQSMWISINSINKPANNGFYHCSPSVVDSTGGYVPPGYVGYSDSLMKTYLNTDFKGALFEYTEEGTKPSTLAGAIKDRTAGTQIVNPNFVLEGPGSVPTNREDINLGGIWMVNRADLLQVWPASRVDPLYYASRDFYSPDYKYVKKGDAWPFGSHPKVSQGTFVYFELRYAYYAYNYSAYAQYGGTPSYTAGTTIQCDHMNGVEDAIYVGFCL